MPFIISNFSHNVIPKPNTMQKKLKANPGGQPECSSPPLIRKKMTTTMTTATATATAHEDFMKREKERQKKEQKFFCDVAAALANGTLTPEHVCSMLEALRDSKIFPDDILDPKDQAEEKQQGFNKIAGIYEDWKITKEEACELFVEWTNEWKSEAPEKRSA